MSTRPDSRLLVCQADTHLQRQGVAVSWRMAFRSILPRTTIDSEICRVYTTQCSASHTFVYSQECIAWRPHRPRSAPALLASLAVLAVHLKC